jgi:hypothetical protein
MPEDIEIDTDKLRETIDEEIEKRGAPLLRAISLTTAIFAALAAVASLRAGATVNEAVLLKTEATRLQALASDQWSYYQAKGIKAARRGPSPAAPCHLLFPAHRAHAAGARRRHIRLAPAPRVSCHPGSISRRRSIRG